MTSYEKRLKRFRAVAEILARRADGLDGDGFAFDAEAYRLASSAVAIAATPPPASDGGPRWQSEGIDDRGNDVRDLEQRPASDTGEAGPALCSRCGESHLPAYDHEFEPATKPRDRSGCKPWCGFDLNAAMLVGEDGERRISRPKSATVDGVFRVWCLVECRDARLPPVSSSPPRPQCRFCLGPAVLMFPSIDDVAKRDACYVWAGHAGFVGGATCRTRPAEWCPECGDYHLPGDHDDELPSLLGNAPIVALGPMAVVACTTQPAVEEDKAGTITPEQRIQGEDPKSPNQADDRHAKSGSSTTPETGPAPKQEKQR